MMGHFLKEEVWMRKKGLSSILEVGTVAFLWEIQNILHWELLYNQMLLWDSGLRNKVK